METINETLEAAIKYARRGWHVFPCQPGGKVLLTKNGLKDATTDESVIRRWWEQWPDANIAVRTGEISGIFAIDIDPRSGGSIEDLKEAMGPLPDTIESATGGGGRHLIFRYPTGRKITNRTNLLPGIDVRGNGGYIIVPPSKTTGTYLFDLSNPPTPTEATELIILHVEREIPQTIMEPTEESGTNPATPTTTNESSIAEIAQLLPYLKSKVDNYQDWIEVGLGIHHSTAGSAEGFRLWNDWSKQSNKYNPAEMAGKWESFSTGNGRGIGSLVHWAKEYGYGAPAKVEEDKPSSLVTVLCLAEAVKSANRRKVAIFTTVVTTELRRYLS